MNFFIVGMVPINTWSGEPVILTVANGGAGLIPLSVKMAAPTHKYPVVSRFLFVRPNEADRWAVEQTAALVHPFHNCEVGPAAGSLV